MHDGQIVKAYRVVLPPHPGGAVRCTGDLGQVLAGGKVIAVGIPGDLVGLLDRHCWRQGAGESTESF